MTTEKTPTLFRPEAQRHASSAEHLDDTVRVVGPLGWLSLVIFWPIIILALVWGIWGRLPTTVAGSGILLRGGELNSVLAQGEGVIESLLVKLGDEVQPGQVLGYIRLPLLEKQITGQSNLVAQSELQLATLSSNQQVVLQTRLDSIEAQRQSANATLADYKNRRETMQRIVSAQETLLKQGLITEVVYYNSSSQLADIDENMAKVNDTLADLDAQASSARDSAEQLISQSEITLLNEQNTLAQLQRQMEETGQIVSLYTGKIVGVEALRGQNVSVNTPIFDLEVAGDDLQAIVFFPAATGKKVLTNMTVRISPATVEIEEYGYIVGTVSYVSDLPVSQQSMNALLRDADLTRMLSEAGPPIRADMLLTKDESTFSGFKWSSSDGPKIRITPGTMCEVQVVTLEQPPITLLIPALRKFFGIVE